MSELLSNAKLALSKLKDKFDDVAIKLMLRDSSMVKIWNNQLSIVQSWRDVKALVYLAKDKRVMELSLSIERPEQIVKICEDIGRYVPVMKESEIYAPLPEPSKIEPLGNLVDKRVYELMEDPSDVVEAMINEALSLGIERVAGTLEFNVMRKALVTSKGFGGHEEGSEVMGYLRVFKGEVSGHWAYGSRFIDLNALKGIAKKASEIATLSKNKVKIEPGKYDVLLSPLVMGNLANYIASMSSGLHLLMGFSMFMKVRIGDRVGSDKVVLYDVPRDVELANSTAFDDEGLRTFNKPIIDRGVFVNVLHNTKTAKKLGGKSTGNAGWIVPRPWNIKLEVGDYGEEELIGEVRKGLFITNNWYTRLQNYVEGQFSTVSRDAVYVIENGEIKGFTERVRIADTFFNLLKNVKALSRTSYLIRWWEVSTPSRVPYVLATKLNITRPFA